MGFIMDVLNSVIDFQVKYWLWGFVPLIAFYVVFGVMYYLNRNK
jgi:hypothetical protein